MNELFTAEEINLMCIFNIPIHTVLISEVSAAIEQED
jgi:hypothetical protein